MARPHGFPRSRSQRRTRTWGVGPGGTSTAQLSASGVSLLGSAITPTEDKLTVMRTRGLFAVNLVTITSGGDGYFGAVGIGKATKAAHIAGIASLPTPITEQTWDGWLWHSFFSVHGGPEAAIGTTGSSQWIEIDSKGMRKFDVDDVLYAAVEVVENGTAVINLQLDTRMLFALS